MVFCFCSYFCFCFIDAIFIDIIISIDTNGMVFRTFQNVSAAAYARRVDVDQFCIICLFEYEDEHDIGQHLIANKINR